MTAQKFVHFSCTLTKEADYERFANRWGVLELCLHGLPATHSFPFCRPTQSEPLSIWRHFAERFRAILRIAAALHQESSGTADDWQTIYENSEIPDWYMGGDIEIGRMTLSEVVTEYLGLGHVQPALSWWKNESPNISLDGAGTFGTIATQVAFAVATSSSQGLAVCMACGQPYFPERKPARGKRNYCPTCRDHGAAKRDAGRDYWRRTQAASLRSFHFSTQGSRMFSLPKSTT